MRFLTVKETKKRGCSYCIDHRNGSNRVKVKPGWTHLKCIYDSCPYHELDKYRTYKDYLNSKESQINIDILIPRLQKRERKKKIL